jgi:putative ABC transport system permease protein
MRSVLLAWLRDWRRHPLQRLLTLLGVTIAIAVVLAVDLANQSAQRAFDRSMLEVAGAATHQILGPVHGFPDTVYTDLRLAGWRDLAPVVEGALRRASGETVYLLGLDPLAEGPFRSAAAGFGEIPIQRLITEPGTVLVPETVFASESAAAEADSRPIGLELLTARGLRRVTPVAALGTGVSDSLWVADIGTAQVLLDRIGSLDRIDVIVEAPAMLAALMADLPEGLDILPVAARDAAARELAQAFRINLTAMSLLALLISAFLIYNTQTFSVLRRTEVLDTLLLVGVTRDRIFAVVILEALSVGLLGTLLGILAGFWLAQTLIGQVAQTVSDHFFVVAVTSVEPRPMALLAVFLLGIGLSVLAALGPAWEAARGRGMGSSGRVALEQRTGRLASALVFGGVMLMLVGAVIAATGAWGLVGGFVALFLLIFGFLLLLPKALVWSLGWMTRGRLRPFPKWLGRMAGRGLEQSLSRSGPAVVALALALAAAIGVSVLVGSFRVSVSEWLGYTLTSDVYLVSAQPSSVRGGAALPGAWLAKLGDWDEVSSVSAATTHEVVSDRGMIKLFVLYPHADWLEWLNLVAGAREGLEQRLRAEDSVLMTEGFAAHQGLRTGDSVSLTTPLGTRIFSIAGVYRDYSYPTGAVLIHADRYYGAEIPVVQSIGLRTADGITTTELEARLAAWLREQPLPALLTRPGAIAEESMAIFDRTFAITHLLRVITLLVAFVAILSALVALQMERAREYAILRTVGLWPVAVGKLVFLQAAALGLFAALAAIPLGLGMGWMLIEVINREAFGWRMDIRLPGWALLENLLLGLVAALLASIYPAWRLARMPLIPALRTRG